MKSLVELDKSVTAQVDTARSWGMIDIRLIVASKKPDTPDSSGARPTKRSQRSFPMEQVPSIPTLKDPRARAMWSSW